MFLRRLVRHTAGLVGGGILITLVLSAALAPMITPVRPTDIDVSRRNLPPSVDHLLGTDWLGRDVFTRIIWGGRLSLSYALLAMAIGVGLGTPFGLWGGFTGGIVDRIFMRVVDLLLAFPTLLLALIVVAVLGPGGIQTVVAIGVALIAPIARLTRGEALRVRGWEFVDAARALGARSPRLMRLHILPNIMAPLLVYVTLRFGMVILTEASLSFLGLGPKPPAPAWGLMVSEGLRFTLVYWWMPILPGMAVFTAVLGANLLGDACRDVLDPRMTRRI